MTPTQAAELKRLMRMVTMQHIVRYRVKKGEAVASLATRHRAEQRVAKAQQELDQFLEQFIERREDERADPTGRS